MAGASALALGGTGSAQTEDDGSRVDRERVGWSLDAVSASRERITVGLSPGCGDSAPRLRAIEGPRRVRLVLTVRRYVPPPGTDFACPLALRLETVSVDLDAPIGGRPISGSQRRLRTDPGGRSRPGFDEDGPPSVTGLAARDAVDLLFADGYKHRIVSSRRTGKVVGQRLRGPSKVRYYDLYRATPSRGTVRLRLGARD